MLNNWLCCFVRDIHAPKIYRTVFVLCPTKKRSYLFNLSCVFVLKRHKEGEFSCTRNAVFENVLLTIHHWLSYITETSGGRRFHPLSAWHSKAHTTDSWSRVNKRGHKQPQPLCTYFSCVCHSTFFSSIFRVYVYRNCSRAIDYFIMIKHDYNIKVCLISP